MTIGPRIYHRRDTTSNWSGVTLGAGEFGYDTTLNQLKIGNGSSSWASLPAFANLNTSQKFTKTQTFSGSNYGESAAIFQHINATSSADITKWVDNSGTTTIASVDYLGVGAFSGLRVSSSFTVYSDGSTYVNSLDASSFAGSSPNGTKLLVSSEAGQISGTTGVGGIEVVTSQGVNTNRYPMVFSTPTLGIYSYIKTHVDNSGSAAISLYNMSTTAPSDYRLKNNIVPYIDGASKILKLNPVTFNWKSDMSNKVVHGFIAHELEEVVPEAVYGIKDAVDSDGKPEYQAIDQSKIIPYLVSALQDALKRIEILEGK